MDDQRVGDVNFSDNPRMHLAWQFVAHTGVSVFLTGKAGTGKTTFLRRLRQLTPKRMAVVAPTGVAAINAGGQTIHSLFQLPFGPWVPGQQLAEDNRGSRFRMNDAKRNLLRTLDLLVIDEVSMVRADLLDQIDATLRRYRDPQRPFGGVQLLLIGDLMQLSPVAKPDEWQLLSGWYSSPYFFSSIALQQLDYVTVELDKIYRQHDNRFIDLLGKVRNGQVGPDDLALLNSRAGLSVPADVQGWIRLSTHNFQADSHNRVMLQSLKGQSVTYSAAVRGDFPESSYPADKELELKPGAQVMFLKNSPRGEYYNGRLGMVTALDDESVTVRCLDDSSIIHVYPETWENTKYGLDSVTNEISQHAAGHFTQMPLRLAWAITVHKSQGLTFDHAVLDINASFAHGQAYVALSRCRSLEGLMLTGPFAPQALITDHDVNVYVDSQLSRAEANEQRLPAYMQQYAVALLDELYSFTALLHDLRAFVRIVDEHLWSQARSLLLRLKAVEEPFKAQVIDVAEKFRPVYHQAGGAEPVADRIVGSCRYFVDKLTEIFAVILSRDMALDINNRQIAKRYNSTLQAMRQSLGLKIRVFNTLASEGYSVKTYLNAKAAALIKSTAAKPAPAKPKPAPKREPKPKAETLVVEEEKKPKRKKGDSMRLSLSMFNDGMTIEQIAVERGLAALTVCGHLAEACGEEDGLDPDQIVSADKRAVIFSAMDSFEEAFSKDDLRAAVSAEITDVEISFTRSLRRVLK